MSARLYPPAPSGPGPLPSARGPLSAYLLERLQGPVAPLQGAPQPADDALTGEDAVLALYLSYELHYRGLAGVDDDWEWEPSLLALRQTLEADLLDRLVELVGPPVAAPGTDVPAALYRIVDGDGSPSPGLPLSVWMAERGGLDHLREFAIHRSAYQLKEADPHTWAIPRLAGAAKAAMIEIQADEYGEGSETDMHQSLFAVTMAELGLDARYGAYLDVLPAVTLATVNLVTFFGLHRRWRGACVGHLAVFEMTSVEPMGRYAAAMRRLGLGPVARHFYEVHVVADAHHEQVAANDLAGNLVAQEPALAGDVLFGARAVSALEARLSAHLSGAWSAGRTSLRSPVPGGLAPA